VSSREFSERSRVGAAAIEHLGHLIAPAGAQSADTQRFAVVPLSRSNVFLVPLASRAVARHSLSEYTALRPLPQRIVRRALAYAWASAVPERLLRGRAVLPSGDETLLGHLRELLGEPALTFAAGLRRIPSFYTPVLQLFRPDGTPVAYAKIGWDDVTTAQVRTESDALRRVAAAHTTTFHAPRVLATGPWDRLDLSITAPLPRRSARVPKASLPPVEPLHEVAEVDGPLVRVPVRESSWWQQVMSDARALDGQPDGWPADGWPADGWMDAVSHVDDEIGQAELRFGRWHGDWVAWNMAHAPDGLYVWDWEYSRAGVPFGFDLLHFFFQEAFVRGGRPLLDAFAEAGERATDGLRRIGLDADEQEALRLLHRLEIRLRAERAVQRGAEAEAGVRETPISTLLARARSTRASRKS
jgi:hypothetical protein